MSATDEQFAAAYDHWEQMPDPHDVGKSLWGRQMLTALQAHCPELFAKPQGLNLLQEVTLRLACAALQGGLKPSGAEMKGMALAILALGEPQ